MITTGVIPCIFEPFLLKINISQASLGYACINSPLPSQKDHDSAPGIFLEEFSDFLHSIKSEERLYNVGNFKEPVYIIMGICFFLFSVDDCF